MTTYIQYTNIYNLLYHRGYNPETKMMDETMFNSVIDRSQQIIIIRAFSYWDKQDWQENHILDLYHQPTSLVLKKFEEFEKKTEHPPLKRGITVICTNPKVEPTKANIVKLIRNGISSTKFEDQTKNNETVIMVVNMLYTRATKDLTKLYKDKDIGKLYNTCKNEITINIGKEVIHPTWDLILYDQLSIDWPRSIPCMPHSIVRASNPNLRILLEHSLHFPTILLNEPGSIWIGTQIGDFVRIDRSTGDIGYRQVILPADWHPSKLGTED